MARKTFFRIRKPLGKLGHANKIMFNSLFNVGIYRIKFISREELIQLETRQRDENLKIASGRPYENAVYTNMNLPPHEKVRLCRDPLRTFSVVIYTRKNFFLLDAMNEKIGMLKASGLIGLWHFQNFGVERKIPESSFPRQLTTEHLMGCFYILFIGCGISFLTFLIEMSINS